MRRCAPSAVVMLWAGSLIISGCKTVYVPNAVNVPLLAQKGELRANLSANNVQAAYALAEGVGIVANGFWQRSSGDQNADSGQDGKGYLVEAGVGHFRNLGDLLLFETYGGLGIGQVEHDNWEKVNGARSDYRYSASALKAFIQPSLGITRPFFDAALSTRFVALRPYSVESVNYPAARLQADDLYGLDDHTFVFVEPAVTVRAGYKWAKLFIQYGFSLKLNQTPLNRDVNFVTAGLHVDFAPRWSM